MLYRIKTRRKPVKVIIKVRTSDPRDIVFIGRDAEKRNTGYFERNFRTDEDVNTLEFPMPYSPNILKLNIYDWADPINQRRGKSKFFEVESIELEPIKRIDLNLSKETQAIVDFILWFSINAGNLSTGIYKDKNKVLTIHYVDKIIADDGNVHPTPARITIDGSNIIEVAKFRFVKSTVPARLAILSHEVAHNFISDNPDDEWQADSNAIHLFDKIGYPSLEFYYAFAKIFNDRDCAQLSRLRSIIQELHTAKKVNDYDGN